MFVGARKVFFMLRIDNWLPPAIKNPLVRLGYAGNKFRYGFSSWEDAEEKCSGYDSSNITKVLIEATRKVVDGRAVYERDGVVFDSIQYSWPLLAALLGAPRSTNTLRVIDWGGSLGSTYRQNREILNQAGLDLEWHVVEQRHLVKIGRSEFVDDKLNFLYSLEDVPQQNFDVAIFAGSICYVKNPQEVLRQTSIKAPARIIFDRTPESKSQNDEIGVQKVGRAIYKASYPIRAFAPGRLGKMLGPTYRLTFEWVSDLQPDPHTVSKGYCFDLV